MTTHERTQDKRNRFNDSKNPQIHCLIQRWKTCLLRRSLLIAAFIPLSHQTDLSAIQSGSEVMILSCPDVHLIYINDISLFTVCLNSLIREPAVTNVWIVRCNLSTFVMCRTKCYLKLSRQHVCCVLVHVVKSCSVEIRG